MKETVSEPRALVKGFIGQHISLSLRVVVAASHALYVPPFFPTTFSVLCIRSDSDDDQASRGRRLVRAPKRRYAPREYAVWMEWQDTAKQAVGLKRATRAKGTANGGKGTASNPPPLRLGPLTR
ncbi:hypothetical protein MRX96_007410 [Rhipicephalus microplus]